MIPWVLLDTVQIPNNGGTLRLHRRDDEFSIRVDSCELMNSRSHGSEEILAELACERIRQRPQPRILIGGLGMGFTLNAALTSCGANATVLVAELIPAVIEWNRKELAALNGQALCDERTHLFSGDVALLLKDDTQQFDAILLDVDNGPDGLTHAENDWLYSRNGLKTARKSLRPKGILAIWSTAQDPLFTKRLQQCGFTVEEHRVRERRTRGARHTIWLATVS